MTRASKPWLPWLPLMVCAVGLLMAFHPTIFSNFALLQTDPGDTRLNLYFLEHSFRWLQRIPPHLSFWDAPFFYPTKNTLAFCDILVALAPIYWIFRWLRFSMETSFQLWMMGISILNFTCAYVLLRALPRLSLSVFSASLGAFLFAFGNTRIVQVGHQQLLAQFYPVISILALVKSFGAQDKNKRNLWIIVFFASIAAQFYAAFYQFWFFGLSLGIVLIFTLIQASSRRALWQFTRQNWKVILAGCTLCALIMFPALSHYLQAANRTKLRHFTEVRSMLPTISSWLYQGDWNWLYSKLSTLPFFSNQSMAHEKRMGIGFVTLVLAIWGLVSRRKDPIVRLFAWTAIAWVILPTLFYFDRYSFTFWKYVYMYIPGARAIRAVSRVSLVMLLPASLGVAVAIEKLRGKGKRISAWLLVLTACVVLEQGQTTPAFDKSATQARVSRLAAKIDPHCRAFLYRPLSATPNFPAYMVNLDAMYAALERKVSTINGYSGTTPQKWFFTREPGEQSVEKEQIIYSAWLERNDLKAQEICWIKEFVP